MADAPADTHDFVGMCKKFLYPRYGYVEEILNQVIKACGYDNIEIRPIEFTADRIIDELIETEGKSSKYISSGKEYILCAVAENDDFVDSPAWIDICVATTGFDGRKCTEMMTQELFISRFENTVFTKPYPGFY